MQIYVLTDKDMEASGGIHVIQTFLSEELCEEVQVMGRTARQGTRGSFSMVLCEEDLEMFKMTPVEIEAARQAGKLYTRIHEKRIEYFNKTFDDKLQDIDAIMENHRQSQQFLAHINDGNTTEAMEYLTRFLVLYFVLALLNYYRYFLIAIYFIICLYVLLLFHLP